MTSAQFDIWFYGALAGVFVGGPIALAAYGPWMRSQDQKYLVRAAKDDLWKQTGISAAEREHFNLFAFYHKFLSKRWELMQDGRDAGYFESIRVGEANFFGALSGRISVTTQARSDLSTLTRNIRFENGKMATIIYSGQSSTHRIVDGHESYQFSSSEKVTYVVRNDGKRVAAYVKVGIGARVLAISKSLPNTAKILICNMATQVNS